MTNFIQLVRRAGSSNDNSNKGSDTLVIKVVVLVVGGLVVFALIFWAAIIISRRQKRMTALKKRILRQRMQLSVDSDYNNNLNRSNMKNMANNRRASRVKMGGPRIPVAAHNTPQVEGAANVPRRPPRLSLGSNVRKSRHEKILQLSPSLRAIAMRAGSSSEVASSHLQAPAQAARQFSSSSAKSPSSSSRSAGSSSSGSNTLKNSTAPSSSNHSKNSSFSSAKKKSGTGSPILPIIELTRLDIPATPQPVLMATQTPPLADSPTIVSRSGTTKTRDGRAQSSGSIIIALDHPPPDCAPVLEMPQPGSWNPSVFGKYTLDSDKHMSASSMPNSQNNLLGLQSPGQRSANNPRARSSRGSILAGTYRNTLTKSPAPMTERSNVTSPSERFSNGSWQTSMTQTDTYSFIDGINNRKPSLFDYQHLSIQPFDEINIAFDDSSDVEKGSPVTPFGNSTLLRPQPNPKNTMTSIASLLRMYSTSGKNSRATTRPPSLSSSGLETPPLPGEISSYRQTIHKVQRSQRDSMSTQTDSPVLQEFILPLFARKPRASSLSLNNTSSYKR